MTATWLLQEGYCKSLLQDLTTQGETDFFTIRLRFQRTKVRDLPHDRVGDFVTSEIVTVAGRGT